MAAVYPGTLATIAANKQDDTDSKSGTDLGLTTTTGDHAAHHNQLAEELAATQAELGTDPAGLYAATVRERFEIGAYKNQSCKFATTANLAATYANGTSGVGATLTANPAAAAPTTDGTTWVVGDRVLVKNQTTPAQNGLYTVTQITSPWILTRSIDADTSAKISDCKVLVDQGTANADTEWYQSGTGVTVGTTSLYFRRTQPIYGHGNPRSLWAPGSGPTVSQPILETVPFNAATGQWTVAVAAPQQWLIGGIVAPAGRTVTNINYFALTAGNAPSVSWFALARQDTRVVQCHTANIVTAPSATAVTTRAFTTPWVPIEDTPVWIIMSYVHATTSMVLAATTGSAVSHAALNLIAPVRFATNGVTPTTTVPTDGTTVITAATAGVVTSATVGFPYFWLT